MTARELRRIYPDSYVLPCRVTFWPETLIVMGPRSEVDREAIRKTVGDWGARSGS